MNKVILGIGEILWDLLPEGKQLGGAPANFTYHAHALGAEAHLISRIGDDALGREILERLGPLDFSLDTVSVDSKAPTGTVSVELDPDGQPRYIIHENVAWDNLAFSPELARLARRADALCFGSLAQRQESSRHALREIVALAPESALRIFDINIRQHYYSRDIIEWSLHTADVLKLNETELPLLADMFAFRGSSQDQMAQLIRRYNLRMIAFTRGIAGSLLFLDGQWSDHPGIPVRVADTIGAGDAFTAMMTIGLLQNWPAEKINRCANEIAAFVCTQSGGMPELPAELRRKISPA